MGGPKEERVLSKGWSRGHCGRKWGPLSWGGILCLTHRSYNSSELSLSALSPPSFIHPTQICLVSTMQR